MRVKRGQKVDNSYLIPTKKLLNFAVLINIVFT